MGHTPYSLKALVSDFAHSTIGLVTQIYASTLMILITQMTSLLLC